MTFDDQILKINLCKVKLTTQYFEKMQKDLNQRMNLLGFIFEAGAYSFFEIEMSLDKRLKNTNTI